MNEFRVWRDEDAHSRSYEALLRDRSRRIARRLGSEQAERRADCLACHAEHGRNIGCVTCHHEGPWIATHSRPGASHKDDVAGGLQPNDDPRRRAELCTSCHLGGTPPRVVDHRLLAAGHPRLVFDLDSATALQPAHYRADAAYVARGKRRSAAVTLWAVGQGVAVARALDTIGAAATSARWPELAVFDCESCHHEIGTRRVLGSPRATPLGLPALNAGAFVTYGVVLGTLVPAESAPFRRELAEVEGATSGRAPDVRALATRIDGRVARTLDAVTAWSPDAASLRRVVTDLAACRPLPYTTAEQIFYGLQSALVTAKRRDILDDDHRRALRRGVRRLYDAIARHERYDPRAAEEALREVGQAVN